MKWLFSRSIAGYVAVMKWAVFVMVAVASLRFLLQPLLGITPEGPGELILSTTIVLMAGLVVHAAWFGWNSGRWGDVAISAFVLCVTYNGLTVIGLSLSVALGLDNHYTHPSHFPAELGLARHAGAHAVSMVLLPLPATMISTVIFVVVWAIRRLVKGSRPYEA